MNVVRLNNLTERLNIRRAELSDVFNWHVQRAALIEQAERKSENCIRTHAITLTMNAESQEDQIRKRHRSSSTPRANSKRWLRSLIDVSRYGEDDRAHYKSGTGE
jgi:hypothetical protein